MARSGSNLRGISQHGLEWLRMALNDSKWSRMVQNGPDWFRLAQIGAEWPRMAQSGIKACKNSTPKREGYFEDEDCQQGRM